MFRFAPRALSEEIIPTEWVGTFSSATNRENFTVGQFGEGICYATGSAPSIEWEFESSGGVREIWAQYAALESRPLRLILNGELLADRGFWEVTGGWTEIDQHSFYQVSVNFLPGLNKLRIEGSGSSPHLRSISVCYSLIAKDERRCSTRSPAENSRPQTQPMWGTWQAETSLPSIRWSKASERKGSTPALLNSYIGNTLKRKRRFRTNRTF